MINGRPHVETGFPILSLRRRHLSASAIFYGRIQLQAKLAVMGAPAARELWESAAVSSLLLGRGGGLGLGEASINGEGRQNRGGGGSLPFCLLAAGGTSAGLISPESPQCQISYGWMAQRRRMPRLFCPTQPPLLDLHWGLVLLNYGGGCLQIRV